MPTNLSRDLDSLADWRRALDRRIEQFGLQLADHDVLDPDGAALVQTLRQRLSSDRLVLAFVAEFSRGKSELINALFFTDAGRRVLPATPGRTTMCPVELAWDPAESAHLSLLPIATRREGLTVSTLRNRADAWKRLTLPLGDPEGLARALQQVTRVQRVSLDEARALGFWDDEHPEDNPPRDDDDQVEVPCWRHALINYPHPLLRRGLVVIDTPGLNAIGAEPELTLGLLPSAHATVFLLAADAGVTRSDLSIWRDHLGDRALERFVVLNKVDTLNDPLLTAEQIAGQVRRQVEQVATTLAVPVDRVFPMSARQALNARLASDGAALQASGLPALEQALANQLLPERGAVIGRLVEDGVLFLQQTALRRLNDRRRQMAEQLAELSSLRGKSGAKLQMMNRRFEADAAMFDDCLPRLTALRSVHTRQIAEVMQQLSTDRVRQEVARMQSDSEASLFRLGAGRAFNQLGLRLHAMFDAAETGIDEIDQMLAAGHRQLNAEHGFALAAGPRPALAAYRRELKRIEKAYGQYFGVTKLWRLSEPGFLSQFMQVLLSRLRVVFENAAVEVELWGKTTTTQMESQLRERRRGLSSRRDAFNRIQLAGTELERRIDEVASQDSHLQQVAERIAETVDGLRILAATVPRSGRPEAAAEHGPRLELVRPAASQGSRGAA
ncbi:dynamin family protein [Ideonella sp. A 288]|uniref:dynamin family protein n=1 Tax=Ideonella sp. A 288 TaxID=1962181 RepID=UPI000B4BF9F8|nr:dynamin family protein [Ideonella sp. A 288]